MPSLLLPSQIDNTLRGSRAAAVILAIVAVIKLLMGFNLSGLNPFVSPASILETVDGIPLSSFPAEAAATVLSSVQSWGLTLLLLAGISILVLVRYRAMVPLMVLVLLLEQVGRMAQWIADDPGGPWISLQPSSLINWGFAVLLLVALVIGLIPRRTRMA
jgi:hypothetical protein